MKDEIYASDNSDITVYHSIYMFFPDQIKAIVDIKKENKYASNAIDLLFIPVFTTFIESILSDIFDDKLRKQFEKPYDGSDLMKVKQNKKLVEGTWWTGCIPNCRTVITYLDSSVWPSYVA